QVRRLNLTTQTQVPARTLRLRRCGRCVATHDKPTANETLSEASRHDDDQVQDAGHPRLEAG
ncbi:MAG TPA: hypothetical protein VE176_11630, partial [Candidatus Limnocylindrales bacterium]|nr:hypothetical protein [Candidatus Limnocylindrales bacterium]